MTDPVEDRRPADHDATDRSTDDDTVDESAPAMGDVDHESPDGTGADRVFERGPPGREAEE